MDQSLYAMIQFPLAQKKKKKEQKLAIFIQEQVQRRMQRDKADEFDQGIEF